MITPERKWFYRQQAGLAIKALRRNGFEATFFEDRDGALAHILDIVPEGAAIGFGDSLTLRQIALFDVLENQACELINPPSIQDNLAANEKRELRFGCFTSDIFFSSANAITLDGKVLNIDGIGNRVAPTIFGPPSVVFVAGANKIVPDADAAVARIKGVAAPMHAWRSAYETPCGRTSVCTDCKGPSRMCRATVILEAPTGQTKVTVILIGETLGL